MMGSSMTILKPAAFALLAACAAAVLSAQTEIEVGQQVYRANCFACHGPDGDQVNGINFKSGTFKRANTDDELMSIVANGIPGTGMPPTALATEARRAVVLYIRSMKPSSAGGAKVAGDAAHGKIIVEGKGACLGCHRVGDKGSHTGPELSDIGSRPAAYLEKSLLDPNETVAPQNRYVHIVTKQGAVINGRRLNEDTHSIQLIDDKERLVSLDKSQLREMTVLKTSPMPSYQGKLSAQEIADVVAYLQTLKGS
jgi:putative heme-binding domain-containing protein